MNSQALAAIVAGDITLPYCGSAPLPAELWARWNFDPPLIALLSAVLLAYLLGAWRLRRATLDCARHDHCAAPTAPSSTALRCFVAGWTITALALISPLCALSVALFSARVAQHLLLMLVAAPLVVLGRPAVMLSALGADRFIRPIRTAAAARSHGRHAMLVAACLAFALLLWLWHAPAPYQASFDSHAAYWAMHASLFGSACLLWHALFASGARLTPAAIAAGLASGAQMGFLGALLTFSPRTLYPVHETSALAWGLSALEDQQLGGLLMWVPGGVLMMAAGMVALVIALRDDDTAHQPGKKTAASRT